MITLIQKHAKNIHNFSDNERVVVAVYGNKAILEHEVSREEWIETDEKNGVLIVDGRFYKYLGRVSL